MKNFGLIQVAGLVMGVALLFSFMSCQMIADQIITPVDSAHAYGTFARNGEDPGEFLASEITNQKYISNDTSLVIQGSKLLTVEDPNGDDNGAGNLTYPSAFKKQVLDLNEVVVSADSTNLYFYIAMANRYYVTPADALKSAGFRYAFIGIFLGKASASPTQTNFGVIAPADSSHSAYSENYEPGFYASGVDVQYAITVLGQTTPNIGTFLDIQNWKDGSASSATVLYTLTTNDLIRTAAGFPNTSPVFAFKVPRGSALTAGDWKLMMYTYGWEDYGLTTCYPGNNGYLRTITGFSAQWNFGAGGSANIPNTRKCADLLANDYTSQTNILLSRSMPASKFQSITLP